MAPKNKEEIERRKKVKEILRKLWDATVRLIENREKNVPYVYAKPNEAVIIAVENKCNECIVKVRSYFVKIEGEFLRVARHTDYDTGGHELDVANVRATDDELVFTCIAKSEARIPISLIKDEAIEDLVTRYIINCVAP